jgi:hypothetical protein
MVFNKLYNDGTTFFGKFFNGKRQLQGLINYVNGDRLIGHFHEDKWFFGVLFTESSDTKSFIYINKKYGLVSANYFENTIKRFKMVALILYLSKMPTIYRISLNEIERVIDNIFNLAPHFPFAAGNIGHNH